MKPRQRNCFRFALLALAVSTTNLRLYAESPSENQINPGDFVAMMQKNAIEQKVAPWGYWGMKSNVYSGWTSHSNRLIPVYTFSCSMAKYFGENSAYRSAEKLRPIYHRVPESTVNPDAVYADQTDIYRLQRDLVDEGYNRVILIVFDGMDWQTTWIAATYKNKKVAYREGRGQGLSFQDYRGVATEFSYVVTSPFDVGGDVDVNAQRRLSTGRVDLGGYSTRLGGPYPWSSPTDASYVIDKSRSALHAVTDSSSSATSLTAGIKTFNGAVNVDDVSTPVDTIAHIVQRDHGWAVGAITSVPISHATPAAAYAHNVSRDDYQDLTRDMLGLPSISCRDNPSPGLDVVIGCGWGVNDKEDEDQAQGHNFVPGNKYLTDADLETATTREDGSYVLAQRTANKPGIQALNEGVEKAIAEKRRLLGFFGTKHGHLPYQTADGDYKPVIDVSEPEVYTQADIVENPMLSQMAVAGLNVLSQDKEGFWVLIEAGDVDWANHKNNVDNSIGAVLSGSDMVGEVFKWIEANGGWDKTAVIVTADHGHYLNITDIEAFTRPNQE